MNWDYRGKRHPRLRNMVLFAAVASAIVFCLVYVLFLQEEAGRVLARIQKPANAGGGENATSQCNDDCYIRLALTTADSSYCRNVSANRSDECWQMFSNSELDACLALSDYEKRKGCIGDFAFYRGNATLCSLLRPADGLACEERITPPCSNESEGRAKELCLAYRYDSSSYCESRECLLAYAQNRSDAAACDMLNSSAERYACRGIVLGASECGLISGAYDADYCNQLLAQYTGDFSSCGMITTGLYKYNCYLSAAVAEHNLSYCGLNELEYMTGCYRNYSLLAYDLEGCKQIDDPYFLASRNGCFDTFAKAFSEPAACGYLSTAYARTNCYANSILAAPQNLSVQKCYGVQEPGWRDKCYSEYAIAEKDAEICEYVQESYEKSRCLQNAAG